MGAKVTTAKILAMGVSPYEALAAAVIEQAIDEDPGWLRTFDGEWWCGLVGLDAQIVYEQALKHNRPTKMTVRA